jgi:hypothetical protein
MRSLAAALLLLTLSLPAAARTPDPQAHEVKLDLDISIESLANAALFDGRYTYTPARLDRNDEVVPTLRRFVRHPSYVYARGYRDGYTREPRTGIAAGGRYDLGRLDVGGEIGAEYDEIGHDPNEHGFFLVPFSVEAGGRPTELLRVGAFYDGRPVVATRRNSRQMVQSERSGWDHRFGGRLTFATPNDRLLLDLSGYGRIADWSYTPEFHPGDVTVRAFGGGLRLSYQASATLSLGLHGEADRGTWENRRLGDDDPTYVGSDLEREVWNVLGGIDAVFWFRGRYAFRFGLGGGFKGAPPVYNSRDTAVGQLNFGLITRF